MAASIAIAVIIFSIVTAVRPRRLARANVADYAPKNAFLLRAHFYWRYSSFTLASTLTLTL